MSVFFNFCKKAKVIGVVNGMLLLSYSVFPQTAPDSIVQLEEVMVEGYPDKRPLVQSPASVGVLNSAELERQSPVSLVPALNTVSGVRMEERSPGSYRLSIRGSLLRSPFGIRNVKIYLDEFPLTDAGGNSYLNLIDAQSLKRVEILKGPHGGLFGANTGGVVIVSPFDNTKDSLQLSASLTNGSYGLFHEKVGAEIQGEKNKLSLYEAWQYSGGYRANSAMERKYIQLADIYRYSRKGNMKAFGFFSDLYYKTPGALTAGQFRQDPSAARPRSGRIAGAEEQNAHIENTSLYGGLSNEIWLLNNLKHVVSVFGMKTDFFNPTINNYEIRRERTLGTRTYLELSGNGNTISHNWKAIVGLEWQKTNSTIDNYGNKAGKKDTIQSLDDVNARQYFAFCQFSATLNRWILEGGISYNHYRYSYRSRNLVPDLPYNSLAFDPQWMPRLAMAYKMAKGLYGRASISRGYSPPTVAEIRPSDNLIYTGLQPEYGWNYEAGVRYGYPRWKTDAVLFYYQLRQAIVRRVNENGTEYFANSGGTEQLGVETQISFELVSPKDHGLLRFLELGNSLAYYQFSFSRYANANSDYSGNRLTGVPRTTVVGTLYAEWAKGFHSYVQYNRTSRIPLNDQNSEYASDYHLVQVKLGWKHRWKERFVLDVFGGVDNLLNTTYSLGNDLNALGGRYYNAAPPRNWFGGVAFKF